jgi:hypothetical protein
VSVSALVSARALRRVAGARGRAHRTKVRLESQPVPALHALFLVLAVLFAFFALAGRQERQLYNIPPGFPVRGSTGGQATWTPLRMTIMITASVVRVSLIAGASAGGCGIALRNAWGACSLRVRSSRDWQEALADRGIR